MSLRLDNSIEENDYVLPALGKPKWLLLVAATTVIAFLVNFSFSEDSIEEWQALSSLVADSNFDEDGT
jgi:hypothetical protein